MLVMSQLPVMPPRRNWRTSPPRHHSYDSMHCLLGLGPWGTLRP
jgi:hypothetical protein